MELDLSAEDTEYRDRLRVWIADNRGYAAYPSGSIAEGLKAARDWQRRAYDAGYVGLSYPREYGGHDAPLMQQVICAEEFAAHRLPMFVNFVGLNIAGPTLVKHGSAEQKDRFLRPILRAEELWCQGYSEPGAGSDLASLRTRAVMDGGDFIVSGQKVWTSLGPVADWCLLLARTQDGTKGQEGISCLLVDMRSAGVEIRPLRNAAGGAHFSEVFFDDARVPHSLLLGTLHEGWSIARSSLDSERSGLSGTVGLEHGLADVISLSARTAAADGVSAIDQDELAELWCAVQGLRQLGYRVLGRQLAGQEPGPEAAVGKLFTSELRQRIMRTALDLLGPQAQFARRSPEAVDDGRWASLYLDSLAHTIGGGTSEVMRNVIAERVLNLPRPAEVGA